MGLIELFKEFHSQAVEKEYPATVRAMYHFFVGELNSRYWQTDELSYSERELGRLTGMSKTAVHQALQYLSDRGLIKVWRKKDKTKTFIKLTSDQIKTSSRPVEDQIVTSSRPVEDQIATSFENSNYACAKDMKDVKDVKTTQHEEHEARTRKKKLVAELDSEVRHAWIQATGENPFGGDAEDLLIRQNRYGAKKVADAIDECRRARTFGDRINMNFLDSKLLKGGSKSGTTANKSSRESSDSNYTEFYSEQLANVERRKQPFDD